MIAVLARRDGRWADIWMPPPQMSRLETFVAISCPMCRQSVSVPDLDVVVQHYRLPPLEQRILAAVWKGKGRAVPTACIFDAMYADDIDGGPDDHAIYKAFNAALRRIRHRLVHSGITIEGAGYRRGYRLAIRDQIRL